MPYQNPIFWFATLVLYFDSSHQLDWCLVDNSPDALCKIERRCINGTISTLSISDIFPLHAELTNDCFIPYALFLHLVHSLSTCVGALSACILYIATQIKSTSRCASKQKQKINKKSHTFYLASHVLYMTPVI